MTPERTIEPDDEKAINQIMGEEETSLTQKITEPKKETKEKTNGVIPHSIHIDGYYKGFHVEVIQTDPNAIKETYTLIGQAKSIVDLMEKDGWRPSWNDATNKALKTEAPKQEELPQAPICEIHKTPMTWKTGVSKKTNKPYAFFACNQRNVDGSFCNYHPPKA
jgi:hypothetical protein